MCERHGIFRQPTSQFSSKHLCEIWYPLANYHQNIRETDGVFRHPAGQSKYTTKNEQKIKKAYTLVKKRAAT
jgi:hypothetical protein